MSQPEQPLYPKLSSIYNKIMQLAIAIFFIVLLMNLSLFSQQQSQHSIEQNFDYTGEQYLSQASAGIQVLLAREKDKELQAYIDSLSRTEIIKEILVYDPSGQLLVSSSGIGSIKDLYGISLNKLNLSNDFIPFAQEIRTDKLLGYVRITLEKSYLTEQLSKTSNEQHQLTRLMMIIAVGVGFLLTRGFSRFSRQGFRLASSK